IWARGLIRSQEASVAKGKKDWRAGFISITQSEQNLNQLPHFVASPLRTGIFDEDMSEFWTSQCGLATRFAMQEGRGVLIQALPTAEAQGQKWLWDLPTSLLREWARRLDNEARANQALQTLWPDR